MNKNQNKNKKVEKPEISEEKDFLLKLLTSYKKELKNLHAYSGSLNHNIKVIKKILEEVK